MNKIKDILTAGRQILFENPNENFPYTLGGSAFLVKINSDIFAVTAKHVLKNNDYSGNEILIRYNDNSRNFIPFDNQFAIPASVSDDNDHNDIIFLHVSKELFNTSIDPGFIIDLPEQYSCPHLSCDYIIITGFPKNSSNIDYDCNHLKMTREPFKGHHLKETQFIGLIEFEYDFPDDFKKVDMNGLSGSPVFCINEKLKKYRIEGMLVRQNYYLKFEIIYKYLLKIVN